MTEEPLSKRQEAYDLPGGGDDDGGVPLGELLRSFDTARDRAAAMLSATMERLVRQVVEPVLSAVERAAAQVTDGIQPRLGEWLGQNGPAIVAGLEHLQRYAGESQVPNWDGLEPEQWLQAVELMRRDDGVPLTWVPPCEVVIAVLEAADHDARDQVLVENASRIAAASSAVLSHVTDPTLRSLRSGVEQGWAAYRSGLVIPAQAAASSAVSGALARWNYSDFTKFRIDFEPLRDGEVDAWGFIAVRQAALLCSLYSAVTPTKRGLPGFNRHATAHDIASDGFTEANALRGLMLATAAVRELQYGLTDEWRRHAGIRPAHMEVLTSSSVSHARLSRSVLPGSRPRVEPRRDSPRQPPEPGLPDVDV